MGDEGNFGIKNAKGEIVIRPKYEYLRPNRDGTFLAKKDGQYTVIDAEGHRISRDSYKDIIRVNPNRFIVKEGNSYSIIDKEGNEIGNETFSAFSYDFDNVPAISDAKADTYSSEDTYSHDRQTSEPPEASASIAVDASASIYDYDGVATHETQEGLVDGEFRYEGEWRSKRYRAQPCHIVFTKLGNQISGVYTNDYYGYSTNLTGVVDGLTLRLSGTYSGKRLNITLPLSSGLEQIAGHGSYDVDEATIPLKRQH